MKFCDWLRANARRSDVRYLTTHALYTLWKQEQA